MRSSFLTLAVVFSMTSLGWAQDKVWTPAPTPNVGSGDTVLPAARAGERLVDDHSTPFSSVPSNSVAADGATSANKFNGVRAPDLAR